MLIRDRLSRVMEATAAGRQPTAATRASNHRLGRAPNRTGGSSKELSLPRAPAIVTEMSRAFDALATTWDAEHGPGSVRGSEFAVRVRYLRTLCHALGRPSVLDLGCGTGQTLIHLADVITSGIGVDVSLAMISRARQNAGMTHLDFRVEDIADCCAKCSERFDLVLLIGVIEHLPNLTAALAGIGRVLTPTGRLVVISPHPWNPIFRLKRLIGADREEPPANHHSPSRLVRLAVPQGLELAATVALPYAPWPELAAVLDFRRSTADREGKCSAFVGVFRGAFAAEFRCAHYRSGTRP